MGMQFVTPADAEVQSKRQGSKPGVGGAVPLYVEVVFKGGKESFALSAEDYAKCVPGSPVRIAGDIETFGKDGTKVYRNARVVERKAA